MRAGLHARHWGIQEAYEETVEGVKVQSEGRSMRGVDLRPRTLAADADTEGAKGRPFSPFSPSPSAAVEAVCRAGARLLRRPVAAGWTNWRCVRHSAAIPLCVIGCEALCPSGGDLYQGSALQGLRAGRLICIPTRWCQDLLSAQKPGTSLVYSSTALRGRISVAPLRSCLFRAVRAVR